MNFTFRFFRWGFETGLLRFLKKERMQVFFWLGFGYCRLPNQDAVGLFLSADLLNFHLKEGGRFRIGKSLPLKFYNIKTRKYEKIR